MAIVLIYTLSYSDKGSTAAVGNSQCLGLRSFKEFKSLIQKAVRITFLWSLSYILDVADVPPPVPG